MASITAPSEKNESRPWPAVLLLERLKIWVRLVPCRHGDRDLWVGPDGGDVVVAGVLVQPVPLVLAAEPVVARPTAVDVAALGAVERAVKVAHNVEVTPAGQMFLMRLSHLGFLYNPKKCFKVIEAGESKFIVWQ